MYSFGPATMRQKMVEEQMLVCYHKAIRKRERMLRGPRLDGALLIVPSDWYKEETATFWRSKGFRYDGDSHSWTRPTGLPLEGKRYAPAVWLERTRARFYEFSPTLRGEAGAQ